MEKNPVIEAAPIDEAKGAEIMEKYEKLIPIDNYGHRIQEVYDMERIVPRQEYLDQYNRMRDELNKLGVEYAY